MKILLSIFITLTISASVWAQKSTSTYNINLKDDQIFNIDSLYEATNYVFHIPEDIAEIVNTPLIRSLEDKNHDFFMLVKFINSILSYNGIGYRNIYPNGRHIFLTDEIAQNYINYAQKLIPDTAYLKKKNAVIWTRSLFSDDNSFKEFKLYYHQLIRNAAVRKSLKEISLFAIEKHCNMYPVFFKKYLKEELLKLLVFCQNIPEIQSINAQEMESYWHGFFYRRYTLDNVPIQEIISFIKNAIKIIDGIDEKNLPEYICDYKINNNIILYFNPSQIKFTVYSGQTHTRVYNKEHRIKSLKCLKDKNYNYYLVSGKHNGENFSHFYDQSLKRIY